MNTPAPLPTGHKVEPLVQAGLLERGIDCELGPQQFPFLEGVPGGRGSLNTDDSRV